MAWGIVRGALAGAAGSTALNAATYLDMAIRGRPASSTPQDLVAKTADEVGLDIPGDGDERENRLQGLGPLAGIATGVAVGAVGGMLHSALGRLPALVEAALLGAAAMALSDVPLKLAGLSDPTTWSAKDWASDVVPHLVYGIATTATLRATDS